MDNPVNSSIDGYRKSGGLSRDKRVVGIGNMVVLVTGNWQLGGKSLLYRLTDGHGCGCLV